LAGWADTTVRQLSGKSELAQAFRYMRTRRAALMRCFDDGHPGLDNNPAERALCCVAIDRKNYSLRFRCRRPPRRRDLLAIALRGQILVAFIKPEICAPQ
jgi:hypothetical protein